jgi:hypothetical protein
MDMHIREVRMNGGHCCRLCLGAACMAVAIRALAAAADTNGPPAPAGAKPPVSDPIPTTLKAYAR